jgi:hypothetical protein
LRSLRGGLLRKSGGRAAALQNGLGAFESEELARRGVGWGSRLTAAVLTPVSVDRKSEAEATGFAFSAARDLLVELLQNLPPF